ncbi:MAG: MBL fold metallo-hydrolase [Candidatus Bathyarchaeia archaeon]
MNCPICGFAVDERSNLCGQCGARLLKCAKCNTMHKSSSKFCDVCGYRLSLRPDIQKRQPKIVLHKKRTRKSVASTLTFYGGVNEIGGNKILLEDMDTKVFLDFGMSFSRAGKFFSEFLQPRQCNGLGDFFELGLLPDLKGLYRNDYLKHMGRKQEKNECQGVLLSHAHLDHAAYIHFLREDIPIYCSKPTNAILKALNDTSSGRFNDLTDITTRFETYINKNGLRSRKTSRNPEIKQQRKFENFEFGKKFRIDNLEIIPFNVDHSLPGSTAYMIYTSSGIVAYTGDFRFHGRRPKATSNFLEACRKEKPDVLIIEGTRIDKKTTRKEKDVESEVSKIVNEHNGLSVCNWPVRDTDRMLSFLNVAKKLDKKLAISLKQAYLLSQLNGCDDKVPNLADNNLALYATRKSWGLIGSNWEEKTIKEDYAKWEHQYLSDSICYKDIRKNQSGFLFFCTNFTLPDLLDLKPPKNSVYIKSTCEPFDTEMEMDWERVNNWINHLGMNVQETHVSGHACGPELKHMIEIVNPKIVVPVHTHNAEIYKQMFKNTHLLEGLEETVEIGINSKL